jgi:hypothetical protein
MLGGLICAAPVRSQPRVEPSLRQYAARVLAHLMEAARAQAIAEGVRPVPPRISRGLLGYFPATILRQARYATGHTEGLSLPALAFTYGDAAAMTLGDVILFRDERAAQTDLKLWAHELTHVMQYQRWGIEGFAAHYIEDSAAVEQEARDNATRFDAWAARLAH